MAKKTSLVDARRPTGGSRPRSMEELIQAVQTETSVPPEAIHILPIERLRRGYYQPRHTGVNDNNDKQFAELVDSIRTLGIIEPIAVRPAPADNSSYEILAGDRRWRAAQSAGLTEVPVIVHSVDDVTAAAIALVENLHRQDLNPLDEATAIQRLINEFNLSQVQVGRLLGKSKSVISRSLGLLSLAEEVQQLIKTSQLDAGHARLLINLPVQEQIKLAGQIVKQGWSVRDLERHKALTAQKTQVRPVTQDPDIRRLENRLGEWLAARVKVRTQKSGGGYMVIRFSTVEEYNGILAKMGFTLDAE
ncbi:MAG: ParB/RepB/Spo0J family partition protein [Candidatus Competibacteraceae bacterium]